MDSHRAVSAAHPPVSSSQTPQPPIVRVHPLPPVWLPATDGEHAVRPASSCAGARAHVHTHSQARTFCRMPAQRRREERSSPPVQRHSRPVSSTNASERAEENPGIRTSQVHCPRLASVEEIKLADPVLRKPLGRDLKILPW